MDTEYKGEERRAEEQGLVGPPDEEVYRTPGREFQHEDGKRRGEDVRQMSEEAIRTSREAIKRARERGRGIVGGQQQTAADELGKYGDALHVAADRLRKENALFADTARSTAEQLDKASRYMKEHSPEEMLRSVNTYARRHPGALWGGMLFAGFALSRFFQASEQSRGEQQG
jgi:hypothetical protein